MRADATARSIHQEHTRSANSLLAFAEKGAALGGAMSIFGYMSLRAHLNTLGISSTGPLGLERYLAEVYLLLMHAFIWPAVIAVFAVIATCGLEKLVRRLVSDRVQGPDLRWGLRVWTVDSNHIAKVLGAMAVIVAGTYYLTLIAMSHHGRAVVGKLDGADAGAGGFGPAAQWLVFYWLLAACAASVIACKFIHQKIRDSASEPYEEFTRRLAYAVYAAVVLLCLQIPTFYGRLLHDSIYPVVEVELKAEQGRPDSPVCGLLVLETEHDIRIWRADNGAGHMIIFPRSENAYTRVKQGGFLDLVESAAGERATGGGAPVCKASK